jgi:hypothetical protein
MKLSIISALCLMLLISLSPVDNVQKCPHCTYIERNEPRYRTDPKQPKPYIHKDSLFIIQPVIENFDGPKEFWHMNEFRLTYKDLHYCSDSTMLTIYLANDSIKMWNIRPRISCRIDMWYRYNNRDGDLLSKYSIQGVKIENRVTDNIYMYKMTDPNYFIKTYDIFR